MGNRKVICAGCSELYLAETTHFYRNKRCCGLDSCREVIDNKIKHYNYQKQRRKYENGTHRRGVEPFIRKLILDRDQNSCLLCFNNTGRLEVHHIVPKCLGGSNKKENLVELTAREHFICHRLLCEIYPKNKKLNNLP